MIALVRLGPSLIRGASICPAPKRKSKATAAKEDSPDLKKVEEPSFSEDAEKPKAKKRKPTQKQLEEAELEAKPRYNEALRPAPCKIDSAFNIVTWNVASLSSTLRKDPQAISRLAEKESAHVVCLQETKLQSKATEGIEESLDLPGWHFFWACSEVKKGYSGTAIFSRSKPISSQLGMKKAAEHDEEGRLIMLEFETFLLINVYTPNAGEGLKRLDYKVKKWDPAFAEYVRELAKRKPLVITGDFNCAHQNMDLHSPWTNKKTPGFTEEERESFGKNLEKLDLVDCFRHQYPDTIGYTYWSLRSGARSKNKGWRLDYFLVSKDLTEKIHDCSILKSYEEEANLSDHCPIGLTFRM